MNGYPVSNGEAPPTLSKPQAAESYQPFAPGIQPTFQLSGPFASTEGISASRWLKKLQYDLKPYYQLGSPAYASEYIEALDALLIGEAAEWAEGNPLMQARITKQSPTSDDLEVISQLMQNRFPQRPSEVHTFDINAKLENLRQKSDETLSGYYKQARFMTKANEVYSKQVDFLWGVIRDISLPCGEKEIAYETLCDLSDSEQVDYLWGVIRHTNLYTEVKEHVYNTLSDMESWSIQSTPLVQPLIVPSTSLIQLAPPITCPPIQPTPLIQATSPILPPLTKPVPFAEPAPLVQPLVVESAPLTIQSNSSIVKLALSFQTAGSGLAALPLIEPVPLDSPVPDPCTNSPLLATIKSNPPTLSITQGALETQVLTGQNVEEKEAIYNQKTLWSAMEISTTNETSLSGSFQTSLTRFLLSLTQTPLSFSLFLLNVLLFLARLFFELLHISRLKRCPVHISHFARIGEG